MALDQGGGVGDRLARVRSQARAEAAGGGLGAGVFVDPIAAGVAVGVEGVDGRAQGRSAAGGGDGGRAECSARMAQGGWLFEFSSAGLLRARTRSRSR